MLDNGGRYIVASPASVCTEPSPSSPHPPSTTTSHRMNQQLIQDIADILDHELFRKACAQLNRDDLKKVKAALESQSASLKRAIEAITTRGGNASGMEAARGHVLRRVKHVDSLFIDMNRSNGHWLVKLKDAEKEGWVKMTVHPSSWLVEQLAAMNEGGEDIDSLSISEVHPITEEQFNQLPENIEHIQK